ncbi:MAG: hypothetical protein RR207_05895 [Clostridia bacterium]
MNSCQKVKVSVTPSVTISDNYDRLSNKPKINGVELSESSTSAELSLLSNQIEQYEETHLGAENISSFLLVLSKEKPPRKVSILEIVKPKVTTANGIPADLEIGNYVFLLKENIKNGADNK